MASIDEKSNIGAEDNPSVFAALDGRKASVVDGEQIVTVNSLSDADEALTFLENHPRAAEVAAEGTAILEDPAAYNKLLWKIDLTIVPLLASVYFLQFLDKTTLSYTVRPVKDMIELPWAKMSRPCIC